jgi:acyl-CoA thioesterase
VEESLYHIIMPKWRNGNEYTAFVKLMSLTKINETTYESACPAYSPGGFTRAFGGHVYAQAAYAAAHTVKEGFVLHVCMCAVIQERPVPAGVIVCLAKAFRDGTSG